MNPLFWKKHLIISLTLILPMFAMSCKKKILPQQSSVKELPLEKNQKLMDFDVAVNYFRQNYAPLKYKEEKFGGSFEPKFAALRAEVEASTTDLEFQGIMAKLIALFQDGHVSISFPKRVWHTIPLSIDLIDGKYVVVKVEDEALEKMGIARGDEVLSIDDQPPGAIAQQISLYSNDGSEGWNSHVWAYYLTARNFVKPKTDMSMFKLKRHKDGIEWDVPLSWNSYTSGAKGASSLNSLPSPGYRAFVSEASDAIIKKKGDGKSSVSREGWDAVGEYEPFFLTDEVKAKLAITKVELTDAEWKEGLPEGMSDKPMPVYAGLYRYKDKSILLMRVATHHIPSQHTNDTDMDIAWSKRSYSKLLEKYGNLADVLVIDQNYNPGGYVKHTEELAKLFLAKPGVNIAFAPRADRMWLTDIATNYLTYYTKGYEKTMWETLYRRIDQANEKKEHLAAPIWFYSPRLAEEQVWTKPILMLINEMDASGGDAFPLLMKENRLATLFGLRTSGMGGNIDDMPALPNSGATISLTRSLFFISDSEHNIAPHAIIENNGVSPDIEHKITIDDFYNGYTDYADAFSQAAVKLATDAAAAAATSPSQETDSDPNKAPALHLKSR